MDKDIIGFLFFVICLGGVLLVAVSCDTRNKKLEIEKSSKCFEQTQDKQCWGIK